MVQIIRPARIEDNISPEAFHFWAGDYYRCKQAFLPQGRFSPVPYFLLCRVIELEIKARHLRGINQKQVKIKYGHDLLRAYNDLPTKEKTLDIRELKTLGIASKIY